MVEQSACYGCCLHPAFQDKYLWWLHQYQPPASYNCKPSWATGAFSPTVSEEELVILNKLSEAWTAFTKLTHRSDHDNKEFLDAIHRAQQLIALRVARRVNPDVWNQPE